MTDDLHAYYHGAEIVVALLSGALVIGALATRLRIPYAVALLATSLPFQAHAASAFAPAVLMIFLPALIFEAAWHLELGQLRKHWRPIAFLAIPGVAVTALTVACGLWLTHLMPFVEGLLVGAIVSATDPIAVIAAFKELSAPKDLATIVEGESLCNDGIAAIMYTAIVATLSGGAVNQFSIALHALQGTVGGIGFGFGVALLGVLGMRFIADVQLQIVTTIVATFTSYLSSEQLGFSGILAVLVTGITLRGFQLRDRNHKAIEAIDRFWGVLAFLSNTLVFLLLGLRIEFARIFHEPLLVLLTLALVLGSRLLLAYGGLPLLGIRTRGWRSIVFLSGMRGALSLALALILPNDIPHRAQIIDAVFGVVAVTLIIQGLAIGPVLQRFELGTTRRRSASRV